MKIIFKVRKKTNEIILSGSEYMLNELIDFIFPKTSLLTEERIDELNSNQYVRDCELLPIPRVTTEDITEFRDKVNADIAFSHFAFREGDDFSKLIYQIKYGGMKGLGKYLGQITGKEFKELAEKERINDFDLIIPVPLHKTKLRERGYNQSDLICEGINKHLNLTFIPDLVKRVRHTSSQTKLTRDQRIYNMKDAFEINMKYENIIPGKRIIIADDVVTTGSTMNEVIKVLRTGNCSEILAITLAMARS